MTSQEMTKAPPDAEEILRQFRSPLLIACRVVMLCVLRIAKWIRRVKWTVRGTEYLQLESSPCIFAANHQSHLDTHVILDALPREFRKHTAVAAAFDHFADTDGTSIRKRALQFIVASLWHAFGIERFNSPLRSIRTMQSLVEHGWSIVIYPEGTRSRTGDIASFKSGLAVIAKRSGCPVIPVHINGGLEILPEATYLPRRGTMTVSFGKPLHFDKNESSTEFMSRVEDAVRAMNKVA